MTVKQVRTCDSCGCDMTTPSSTAENRHFEFSLSQGKHWEDEGEGPHVYDDREWDFCSKDCLYKYVSEFLVVDVITMVVGIDIGIKEKTGNTQDKLL